MKRTLCSLVGFMLVSVLFAQQLIPTPKSLVYKSQRKSKITTVDAKVDTRLSLPEEGYTLDIRGSKAVLRATTAQGLVWAKATLAQLQDEDGKTPQVSIKDYPSFKIRGFMHDTGRNFRPVALLKKEIDLFSAYKLNVFHWHLTDNPAWRIECHAYPQLNDARFQRAGRDEGKFYTYDEIRDVIRYARERGVLVIPEIDMPGHSEYFLTTFGFKMATPEGMKVLEACLKEFMAEIPVEDCPYLHIGSDEVRVSDPKGFMAFCENILREGGRTPIAWDPGLPSDGVTIGQVWRGQVAESIRQSGYEKRYIDSYHGYLNGVHPVQNVTKYLQHQFCAVNEGNEKALGGILCLWNDVRIDDKEKLFAHNGATNGLLAFAERIWCGGPGVTELTDETLSPEPGTDLYARLQDFESRLAYHRDHQLYDWDMRWVSNRDMKWQVTLPQRRGTDVSQMEWVTAWGGVLDFNAICAKHQVKVLPTMDAWAETILYAERDTVISVMIGFDVPARSNRKSPGIGHQGYWEMDGRVFVNGEEIFPEPWNEPEKYTYYYDTWGSAPAEIPYTDEQFCWMRAPKKIALKAGKNTVRLYCPILLDTNWVTTFIPVTVDSKGHLSEVRGIRFR
ncbi:MAG: family 20 glycosylhydrolase [Bacteroidales bacterium]|nr:family 20 glycosylhydrolase [Bacteroidales bacterium]